MKLLKITAISAAILSSSVMAEWSANVGMMSEYHFRGIVQNATATMNGGVDYEADGFYAGAWAADVEDGLEIDFYAGYGVELDGGIALSAGLTTYQYTGDFDSAYNELNLGVGFGLVSLEYTLGQHDEDTGLGIPESDYSFTGLSIASGDFGATVGIWGKDFEGEYLEVTYGTTIGEFDVGAGLVISGSDLDDDESLYLTIGKTF